jgi:DNA polymerase III gamma/tau subunit
VDGEEKLMGGPLTSVAAHATHGYVIISPGTTKKSNVARMLAKAFTVSTETAEKVLPPGDCTIIQTIGIELS